MKNSLLFRINYCIKLRIKFLKFTSLTKIFAPDSGHEFFFLQKLFMTKIQNKDIELSKAFLRLLKALDCGVNGTVTFHSTLKIVRISIWYMYD